MMVKIEKRKKAEREPLRCEKCADYCCSTPKVCKELAWFKGESFEQRRLVCMRFLGRKVVIDDEMKHELPKTSWDDRHPCKVRVITPRKFRGKRYALTEEHRLWERKHLKKFVLVETKNAEGKKGVTVTKTLLKVVGTPMSMKPKAEKSKVSVKPKTKVVKARAKTKRTETRRTKRDFGKGKRRV